MVVDYRELNHKVIPDGYPSTITSDQISWLSDANYYTGLDCASGYNQIPIPDPYTIERTVFIEPDGLNEI